MYALSRILHILISKLQVTDEGKETQPARDKCRGEGKGPLVESLGSYLFSHWMALSEILKTSVVPFPSVIWRYIGAKFQVLVV